MEAEAQNNQTVSLDTNHFIQAEAQTNQTMPLGGS